MGGVLRATMVVFGIVLAFAPAALGATLAVDVAGDRVTYDAAVGKINRVTFSVPVSGTVRIERLSGDDDPIVDPAIAECVEVAAGETYDCTATVVDARGYDLDDFFESELTTPTADFNSFTGGDGEDEITGGPGNDSIEGENDDDTLDGGGGDDLLNLGTGSDSALGGPGSDWFNLNSDAVDVDQADGGADDDTLLIPRGEFDARGGSGRDTLIVFAQDPGGMNAAEDHSYTLDDAPNDGAEGQGGNAHSDFEDLADYYGSVAPLVPEGTSIEDIGRYVLTGNAGNNSIVGGPQADTLEGGDGNDLLSAHRGDDTLLTRDGYADVVRCGQGQDTAVVDTLDQVSETCETVQSEDVGNANDVPEIPEDRPPTVAFGAPAAGATLGSGVTVLTADAADDHGVARVLFMDDDRIVCTDTTAPYTCDYQPRGEDVGRNTLAVMAVDGAEQTATAFRAVNVPRFSPTGLSLKVTPRRDRRAPFRFRSSGSLGLPPQVTSALGCAGELVTVRFKAGKRTVASRRVALQPDCTFRSRTTLRLPRRLRKRNVYAQAIFAGNEVLAKRSSARKRVRTR